MWNSHSFRRREGESPLFSKFLKSLGIDIFTVTDIDATRWVAKKLCNSEPIRDALSELRQGAQRLVEDGELSASVNSKFISKLSSGYQWNNVWDQLWEMHDVLINGSAESPTDEQLGCLQKLLQSAEEKPFRKALKSKKYGTIKDKREELSKLLLKEKILLLCGNLEDYYPSSESRDKITLALEFEPADFSKEELYFYFTHFDDGSADVEIFLQMVFA